MLGYVQMGVYDEEYEAEKKVEQRDAQEQEPAENASKKKKNRRGMKKSMDAKKEGDATEHKEEHEKDISREMDKLHLNDGVEEDGGCDESVQLLTIRAEMTKEIRWWKARGVEELDRGNHCVVKNLNWLKMM